MHKYMTIHTTETGDHANFFEHYDNAYQFYHDMRAFGYPVALYGKPDNRIYSVMQCSWNEKEEDPDA